MAQTRSWNYVCTSARNAAELNRMSPPPAAESSSLMSQTYQLRPIGVVHSPYNERQEAPRQPRASTPQEGSIELFPMNGLEHALADIAGFRYLWVLFWFHQATSFRPKVLPPRSERRRGVFSTRSPYRPNPIGLSAVELLEVNSTHLRVRDLDMLEGTPVLDIKPYIAYTDALPDAAAGWLEEEKSKKTLPSFVVTFAPLALEQLSFLAPHEADLRARIEQVLEAGPTPHPYRRIKLQGTSGVLAQKAWRIDFSVEGQGVHVVRLRSGYRPASLFAAGDPHALHRQFVERFGL
jgi:tRNA (adenine37-N6)-methyltransferase